MVSNLRFISLFLLAFSFLYIIGCGEDSTPIDAIPPSPPQIIPVVHPTTIVDTLSRPIDLGSSANSFLLRWRPPIDTDVREWEIYMIPFDTVEQVVFIGRHPFNRNQLFYIIQDGRLLPDPVSGNVRPFKIWMHAIDEAGNRSAASDTITFALLEKASGLTVSDTTSGIPYFQWQNPYSTSENAPDRFVVKVFSQSNEIVWMWYQVRYDSDQNVRFNEDLSADTTFLIQGRLRAGNYRVRLEYWIAFQASSFSEKDFTIGNNN
ncbi:MAG: hypothetical protein N2450_02980 [bacterium]|nr:hypothetical protein [bacterium]